MKARCIVVPPRTARSAETDFTAVNPGILLSRSCRPQELPADCGHHRGYRVRTPVAWESALIDGKAQLNSQNVSGAALLQFSKPATAEQACPRPHRRWPESARWWASGG